MNIKNNIINYLFDKDYIVAMYENYFYIFNYKYLEEFDDKKIVVSVQKRKFTLKGIDLLIVKITKEELLIKGVVNSVEVNYVSEQ